MEKIQGLFNRMIDGVDFDELSEDFYALEEEIINNPFILEHATKEELAVYNLLKEIPEEDVHKSLENMVGILSEQKNLSDEERSIILGMDREFLILLLFSRWTQRAENGSHKKSENSAE